MAGVVASTIFIEDNKLVEDRSFWFLLLVIVLKVISINIFRKYTGKIQVDDSGSSIP
jgi:hypothetical protein